MNVSQVKGRTGDFEVPKDDPFKNDKLVRKDLVVAIARMLERVEAPFVACVDSPWGTGKTTFLQMCRQHMSNQGLKSVYFNAWSTDFADDPLAAFVGELAEFLETLRPDAQQKARLQKLRKFTFYLAKRAVPIVAKAVTLGGLDIAGEREALAADLASELGSDLTEAFDVQKSMVKTFRDLIEEIVTHLEDGDHVGRLVILVDELDRCRPTYSIEVLERIKHLFDVPNVVFLIALDMQQLCSSIRAVYGAGMDAPDYLRRFIDVEYRLPEVNSRPFLEVVFKELGISGSIWAPQKVHSLVDVLASMSKMFGLSLRAQIQCAARMAIGFHLTEETEDADALFVMALIVLRASDSSIYRDFVSGKKPADEIVALLRALTGGRTFLDTDEGKSLEAFLRCTQPNEQAAIREMQSLQGQADQKLARPARILELFHYFRNRAYDLRHVLRRIDIGFGAGS